jgi:hypothetical protein
MIQNWDADRVISECQKIHHGANDPYVTGRNNWPCKQDLYHVKFAVDKMLKNTSRFIGEEEWLKEQEQGKMWKTLKSQGKT